MAVGAANLQGVAGGTIRTSRFIKLSTAADYTFLEADANEQVIGVSSQGAQDAPIPAASANAAESGDSFMYYGLARMALVDVGSGGVTKGALLKSDADGSAVLALTSGTTGQWVAGWAQADASENELVEVFLWTFFYRPAIA